MEDLYSQNTMKLHSIADVLYVPESLDELRELVSNNRQDYLLLSAGSNIILPERLHRPVISLMSLDGQLQLLDDGTVCAGCSVRVQRLIRFLQEKNLGGIEYLFSVPASVGGLVYMNAGRGEKIKASISDYLESVIFLDLDDLTIKTYHVARTDFSYRSSPFQRMNAIILTCYFKFLSQDAKVTEKLITKRLQYSEEYLSADKPSCGSIFKKGNRVVYRLLRGMRVGDAMFSNKTSNWISNMGNASYEDICLLIKRAQLIHKLFLSKCDLEVKVIKE